MDDTNDLVERLLVLAGGLMEDASSAAVLRDSGSVGQRIAVARQAARDVGTLLEAVDVIQRAG